MATNINVGIPRPSTPLTSVRVIMSESSINKLHSDGRFKKLQANNPGVEIDVDRAGQGLSFVRLRGEKEKILPLSEKLSN
jgi:hypothetical protein